MLTLCKSLGKTNFFKEQNSVFEAELSKASNLRQPKLSASYKVQQQFFSQKMLFSKLGKAKETLKIFHPLHCKI